MVVLANAAHLVPALATVIVVGPAAGVGAGPSSLPPQADSSTAAEAAASTRWRCVCVKSCQINILSPVGKTDPTHGPVGSLNPVEHLWDELRDKHFHNRFFDSLEDVEEQLASALASLEHDAQRVRSITAWPWIAASIPN
jgi:hypothetical protein